MKKTLIPIALAVALIALAPAAFAATASGTLTVNASVAANCTIAASATLGFGAYDPVVANSSTGIDLDASTTMGVACTKGFDPIITIPLAGRTITGGGDTLNYQLFSDSTRLVAFGETLATGFHMGAAPSKAARNVTIYGRIPKNQDVGVAAYTGTIQVSVNF
jgi:spore coat protein U-like protein